MAVYCYNGSFSSLLRNYHPYPHTQKDSSPKKPEPRRSVHNKASKIQGWVAPKEETSDCFDEWCSKTKTLKDRPKSSHVNLSWPTNSRCSQMGITSEKESLNKAYLPETLRGPPFSRSLAANNSTKNPETRSAPAHLAGSKAPSNTERSAYGSISNNPFDKGSANGKTQRPPRLTRSNTVAKPQLFKITCSIVPKDKPGETSMTTNTGIPTESDPIRRESLPMVRSDTVINEKVEHFRAPLSRSSCHSSANDDFGKRPMTRQPPIVEHEVQELTIMNSYNSGGSHTNSRSHINSSGPSNQINGKIPEIIPREIVLKSRAEQINYIHSRINALESELTRSRLLPGVTSALSASTSESRAAPSRAGSHSTMSHHPPATPSSIRQATSRLLSYNGKYCLSSFPNQKYGNKGNEAEDGAPDTSAFSKPATPPRLKMAKKDKHDRQGARTVIPSKITVQEAIPEIGMTWKFQRFPDKSIPESAITAKMKLF